MADAETNAILTVIAGHLEGIKTLLQSSFDASEALRLQAEAAMASQAQALEAALQPVPPLVVPDWSPFESVPTGTEVRDLPDGGRLFLLSDGSLLKSTPELAFHFTGNDGETVVLPSPSNRALQLPTGAVLTLREGVLQVAVEEIGIEGLPIGIDPIVLSENRYRLSLPGDLLVDVYRDLRTAVVIDPSGCVLRIGSTIEGIGEAVEVAAISSGLRSFKAAQTGHQGIVDVDGTIRLVLSTGIDITFTFPEPASNPADSEGSNDPCDVCGLPHPEVAS